MAAVIVDAVRTAVGRAHAEKGAFCEVRADDLAAACVRALVERTGIDPRAIEDLRMGCSQPTLEQGFNLGRVVSLLAGLPYTTAGTTVNRWCGSSLEALHQAAHAIVAGAEEVQIVAGVEHMHHLPMGHGLDVNPKLYARTSPAAARMGLTAELLATRFGITRREQDEFALRSHQLAARAHDQREFQHEIVPVFGRSEQGERMVVERDQCVRADAKLETLSHLPPAFDPNGSVTAGNSSPLNDGAAALLVMSTAAATRLGLKPLARIVATAVVGLEPALMGLGPVAATTKALARAGLKLDDIDAIELNEAFAVQALACVRQLGLEIDRVNARGGAIAIGHPLGASGARIMTTLLHRLHHRGQRFGLATMCIGLGQGIATIVENIS